MSDVSFEQAHAVFISMEYELVLRDVDLGFALYRGSPHPRSPEQLVMIDFSDGAVARLDLERQLEREGFPVQAFFETLVFLFG